MLVQTSIQTKANNAAKSIPIQSPTKSNNEGVDEGNGIDEGDGEDQLLRLTTIVGDDDRIHPPVLHFRPL